MAATGTALGFRASLSDWLRRPVRPADRGWVLLGSLTAVLLFLQGATGVLLSLYYLPSPESAADSVRYVMVDVEWGWLVRGAHRYGTGALVVVTALQLARVLILGAYRGPRAASWVLSCLGLLLVIWLGFTGELLPWDHQAVALAAATLEGVESLPLVGPPLADLMRGGATLGAATLARAYATHALILPWVAFLLLLVDFAFRARQRAGGAR